MRAVACHLAAEMIGAPAGKYRILPMSAGGPHGYTGIGSGDKAPGQANGAGKAGQWYVTTPQLSSPVSTPPLILTATVSSGGALTRS